jgi:nucleoid DNA-binding protein
VARAGRDPRSGEPIEIPARITLAFSPGQELRVALNRK